MSQEISRDELRERLDELTLVEALPLLPDLEAEIVVYCGSWLCRSSDRVAEKLRHLGYTYVGVYRGGKADWRRTGLATVRSA